MIAPVEDQASSLRRLLGGSALRSALFIGGDAGIGQTALVAATADAMARRGHSVLVVDAQPQMRSGAGWFGLFPRGDLAEALSGQRRLDEVLLHASGGVTWVPAARLGPAGPLPAPAPGAAPAAGRALSELASRFDCVLIDVPSDRVDRWWPAAAQAGSVLLGSTDAQRSVTAAYSALKMLAIEVGQQRYLWWMARAADANAAQSAWRKVAQTARRFLQVQVEYAGAVPADPMVPRAERLHRPLADVFPGSRAAAAGAALAGQLDVPMLLPGSPADAWRALLLGEAALDGVPAQNAGGRDGTDATVRLSSLDASHGPSHNPSPAGSPDRTALVSR